jgi:hypothetical protein
VVIPAVEAGLPARDAGRVAEEQQSAIRYLSALRRFSSVKNRRIRDNGWNLTGMCFLCMNRNAHCDSPRLNNLFRIFELLLRGGIKLSRHEIYLLSLAICIHDLGMVCALRDWQIVDVLEGAEESADPAALEDFIREAHHKLVENYLEDNAGFLTSAGVSVPDIGHVRDISKCHRKVILEDQSGFVKHLGALRIIDELDVSYERAPADILRNSYREMDATSCWHWFKHNIVEPWQLGHTVSYEETNRQKAISFYIGVCPTEESTIPYWATQTLNPIIRVLRHEGARKIILERFSVEITAEIRDELCKVNKLDQTWQQIEKRALSSSHPVILVVDDEFRKYQDLFLPLIGKYHIMSATNANDALIKIQAARPRLVIVDMQVSSGGIWTDSETKDFKFTGYKLCQEIRTRFPDMLLGTFTGTRYPVPDMTDLKLSFDLRKPVDPDYFVDKIQRVLS